MRLYDNDYFDYYDRYRDTYPVWYREVQEMDAIWRVNGGQLNDAKRSIIGAVDNNFVSTADPETLAKLEQFLHIKYTVLPGIEERRATILAHYFGQRHFGRPEIRDIMAGFTSDEVDVDLIGGAFVITVVQSAAFDINAINELIDKRKSGHLGFSWLIDSLATQTLYTAAIYVEDEEQDLSVPGLP